MIFSASIARRQQYKETNKNPRQKAGNTIRNGLIHDMTNCSATSVIRQLRPCVYRPQSLQPIDSKSMRIFSPCPKAGIFVCPISS